MTLNIFLGLVLTLAIPLAAFCSIRIGGNPPLRYWRWDAIVTFFWWYMIMIITLSLIAVLHNAGFFTWLRGCRC